MYYFAEGSGEGVLAYCVDIFSEDGAQIVSKCLGMTDMEAETIPFAQLIQEKNGLLLEYYPDITSMEVCYQTRYAMNGKRNGKEQKIKQKSGESFYVQHAGKYVIRYQAHGDEERSGGENRKIEIIDIPSGKKMKMNAFDWLFSVSATNAGELLLGQRTASGALQISRISYKGKWNEKKLTVTDNFLAAHPFARLASLTEINGQIIAQIQAGSQTRLLAVDIENEIIVSETDIPPSEVPFYMERVVATDAGLVGIAFCRSQELQRDVYRLMDISNAKEIAFFSIDGGKLSWNEHRSGKQGCDI